MFFRPRTVLTDIIPEKSTALITFSLVDENGNAIKLASLGTLTLTLYASGQPSTYINSRNAQNVLNNNGVTVDSNGNVSWDMIPADNIIVLGSLSDIETHIALFQWTYSSGAKAGRHEIQLGIQNMDNVS